ncbi:MAG: hypothetical protein BWZ10_00542 [candidate division BRC1 bacterium ADurb.BinA364]|nr:MAG: hypothetical protein BWZ10_00542 [candidate division BRC1 bacterium ADurb.BinA364]
MLSVKAWRRAALAGRTPAETTPLQIADSLAANARTVRGLLPELRAGQGEDAELRATLNDIEMFAMLGEYYAEKLRAACELALFDASGDETRRAAAVGHLESALEHWKAYGDAYTSQYVQPVLYNRVGWVDIPKLAENCAADIEIARQWKPGTLSEQDIQDKR